MIDKFQVATESNCSRKGYRHELVLATLFRFLSDFASSFLSSLLSFFLLFALSVLPKGKLLVRLSAPVDLDIRPFSLPKTVTHTPRQNKMELKMRPAPSPNVHRPVTCVYR